MSFIPDFDMPHSGPDAEQQDAWDTITECHAFHAWSGLPVDPLSPPFSAVAPSPTVPGTSASLWRPGTTPNQGEHSR